MNARMEAPGPPEGTTGAAAKKGGVKVGWTATDASPHGGGTEMIGVKEKVNGLCYAGTASLNNTKWLAINSERKHLLKQNWAPSGKNLKSTKQSLVQN